MRIVVAAASDVVDALPLASSRTAIRSRTEGKNESIAESSSFVVESSDLVSLS